jgi:hydrogenase-4 component B
MMAMPLDHFLFWLMAAGYLAASAGLIVPGRRTPRYVGAAGLVIGGAAGLGLAGIVLWSGQRFFGTVANAFVLDAPDVLAAAGGVMLHLDRLAAIFLALISAAAIPAGIYSAGYLASYEGRYSTRWMTWNTGLFLLSMSLVTCAGNVLTFVLAWEAMALSSFFLVMTEQDRADTVAAGLWYLGMTHAGLLALLVAFFLMGTGGAPDWSFAALRAGAPSLSPATRNAVFLLALVGFGSKAGLAPLHVWLPKAHPAAPSHVSALMSAVMVKLGIYGLLRVCLDILGGGPAWWGMVLIVVGAGSALVGVLYALVDDDLKRLLAYSTVENVGLVCLGLGAGFLFHSLKLPGAATLAFAAALLHVVNHAAFKGTLFLAAGSVVHGTGSRDMNLMGGLIKRSPWTAASFLVGAMAISALPPLNGFVSEWLLFQSFLPGVTSARSSVSALLTLGVGALALAGGLAAATFTKAFGISFLAIPRSESAAQAHECGLAMRAGMGMAAICCPLLTLTTVPVLTTITGTLANLSGLQVIVVAFGSGGMLHTPNGMAAMSPVTIAGVLLLVVLAMWLGYRITGRHTIRIGNTWGCGRIGQTPRMEYTSTAFAEPLRRVFEEIYRPTKDVSVNMAHPDSPYHIQSVTYRTKLHPWFQRAIYDPLFAAVETLATWTRRLQSGSVAAYLGYIVLVLVVLLIVVIGF